MARTLALLFAMVAGLAAFLVFFAWWERTRVRMHYAALRNVLGGTLKGKALSGAYKGLPFRISYWSGGRQSSPGCMVGVDAPFPGKLTVRRETDFDRAAKGKDFVVEVQTGDAEFDGKYFIDTRDPDFSRAYLEDRGKRESIAVLLEGTPGAAEVRIGPKGVSLLVRSFAPARLLPAEVTANLDRLVTLTERVPEVPALPESHKQPAPFRFLLAAIIGFDVLGAAGAVFSLTRYPPVDGWIVAFSLLFSVPLAAAFLYFAHAALKGGSSSHNLFGILVALSLFAFGPAGVAVAVLVNGSGDAAPPALHAAPVVGKQVIDGEDGDILLFTERKGRLGFLWRDGFQVKRRP